LAHLCSRINTLITAFARLEHSGKSNFYDMNPNAGPMNGLQALGQSATQQQQASNRHSELSIVPTLKGQEPQEDSLFLTLAGELRNQIYEYSFQGKVYFNTKIHRSDTSTEHSLSLACRQLYHEVHGATFERATFVFGTGTVRHCSAKAVGFTLSSQLNSNVRYSVSAYADPGSEIVSENIEDGVSAFSRFTGSDRVVRFLPQMRNVEIHVHQRNVCADRVRNLVSQHFWIGNAFIRLEDLMLESYSSYTSLTRYSTQSSTTKKRIAMFRNYCNASRASSTATCLDPNLESN